MNQKYGPVLIAAAIIVAGLLGGWVSQTTAAAPGNYELRDASGTYLGDVLGVVAGTIGMGGARGEAYTTYLPSINGVVQFTVTDAGLQVLSTPVKVLYDSSDCEGNKYTVAGDNDVWTHPWILRVADQTYKIATSSTNQTFLSESDGSGGNCQNSNTGGPAFKLKLVALPFDINEVTLPFKIK